jgi:hypothetical protein
MNNIKKISNNCIIVGNSVISYETEVARIEGNNLIVNGYYSKTTSKHINTVARELNLTKVIS